jgi:hypothetical protein
MWRAFFLAIGITLCIWGAECLVLDRAILAAEAPPAESAENTLNYYNPAPQLTKSKREIVPPEWAPWSLMSSGAVIILYSFTLPRRVAG